ncbi:MAG: histone deacetylase [Phycisphaerales bacterium]
MPKFAALRRMLQAEALIRPADVVAPWEASLEALRLIHTDRYVDALVHARLTIKEERRLGLPWSEQLLHRSRLAVTGTTLTARHALEDGRAANLAGGTHHACPDHGEGYCVFNDVAIAIRQLQRERPGIRCLIIDLDVHHGNGNAIVFGPEAPGGGDPNVYTFSMHGARNFPLKKPRSDLDVPLPDGMHDEAYLARLEEHLPAVIDAARPDLAFYLAGVDTVVGDRFGRLRMTRAGVHRRDGHVLRELHRRGIPTAMLLAGGYARTPEATADLHAISHREAAQIGRPPADSIPLR